MIRVLHGDCLDLLRGMADNSVDAIVTDPPAGISFMGSAWDSNKGGREQWSAWLADVMAEAFRVVKPGGHALVWALPRTAHWTACGLEDAGWDIRDCVTHIFATGFPKSLDVSKAIDKLDAADERRARALEFTDWMRSTGITSAQINTATSTNMGGHYLTAAEQPAVATADLFDKLRPLLPEVPARIEQLVAQRTVESENFAKRPPADYATSVGMRGSWTNGSGWSGKASRGGEGVTDAARQWQGWGTALKPAAEFWWLVRKPLAGTVASNVAAWGTGAINIDATRVNPGEHVPGGGGLKGGATSRHEGWRHPSYLDGAASEAHDRGRWPSNLILSHGPGCGRHLRTLGDTHCRACNLELPTDAPCEKRCVDGCPVAELDQQSGVRTSGSRKAGKYELMGYMGADAAPMPEVKGNTGGASRFFPVFRYQSKAPSRERPKVNGVAHATVKPLALCRWMIRLVTPPGGVILDMFAGSGTTGEAAALEGFDCILIEREPSYLPLIAARLERAGADHDCPTIADTPQDDEERTA